MSNNLSSLLNYMQVSSSMFKIKDIQKNISMDKVVPIYKVVQKTGTIDLQNVNKLISIILYILLNTNISCIFPTN